ncbi:MAG TPA: M56 family metallopeptidase, partial [Terriglobus sp.]
MTTLTAFLASYIVSALWQVPLLYLAGCIVAYIVRRIGPAAEHRVWITVLLLCVIIPALPAPGMHGHSTAITITEAHVHHTATETTGSGRGWDIPLWLPLKAMQAIVALWLLTVLYAATRLVVGILRTRRLLREAQPYALQPNEAQLWQHSTQQFGLHNTVVLESETIQSPVTGTDNHQHILLLPTNFFATVTHQDAQAALAHEAAHMRRNDYRNNILLHAAATVIFFHPFTLLLRRQLTSSREMACDHAASVQVGSAHTYRTALLRLAMVIAQGRPVPPMAAAIGIFDSHSLEDRLNRLEKEMPNTNTIARYALAAIAFLGISITASALALNGMRLLPASVVSKALPSVANPT